MKQDEFKNELVKSLFDDVAISKVKKLIKSGDDKIALELFDMTFRLFKPTGQNINLELLTQTIIDKPKINKISKMVTHLQPVGFYTWESGFFSNKISVNILNEFESIVEGMIKGNKISSSIKINKLSFIQNAIIGGFSMDTFIEVEKIYSEMENNNSLGVTEYDKKITVNGIEINLIMSFDGFPQMFVIDDSNKSIPIGAFPKTSGNISCNPARALDADFHKFYNMGLLSAFKGIN